MDNDDSREQPSNEGVHVDLKQIDWSHVYQLPRVYDDEGPSPEHADLP